MSVKTWIRSSTSMPVMATHVCNASTKWWRQGDPWNLMDSCLTKLVSWKFSEGHISKSKAEVIVAQAYNLSIQGAGAGGSSWSTWVTWWIPEKVWTAGESLSQKKLNISWRAINENNWSQPLAFTCMGTHKATYTERIQCFSGEKNQYLDNLKY